MLILIVFVVPERQGGVAGDASEQTDNMFITNTNLRHPRRHAELYLPSRPFRGEPPSVAGTGCQHRTELELLDEMLSALSPDVTL